MLDIHYELRCKGGNDEITDMIKNQHKKLTERVRAIIEQYIVMSNDRFGIDWRNVSMSDVGKMFEFVTSVINKEFNFFRTVLSPTVVYGPRSFPFSRQTVGLIAGNQIMHFNVLDDDSYNQFTLISDVVYCDKDANAISISRLSKIECPNLAPCMPYSNPDSILNDSDVPELMENDSDDSVADYDYPVFSSDTPSGFGIPESRRDGTRLINHAHDIDYEFDAPLAPIN